MAASNIPSNRRTLSKMNNDHHRNYINVTDLIKKGKLNSMTDEQLKALQEQQVMQELEAMNITAEDIKNMTREVLIRKIKESG